MFNYPGKNTDSIQPISKNTTNINNFSLDDTLFKLFTTHDKHDKTNENNPILDSNTRSEHSEAAIKLKNAVLEFQKTKDPSVFDEFLPYQRYLKNDPSYKEDIDLILRNPNIKFYNDNFIPGQTIWSDIEDKTSDADIATKYLLAASLAGPLHGRKDLLETIAKKELKIAFTHIPRESGIAALYSKNGNWVAFDILQFYENLATQDGINNTQHELIGHALDDEDEKNNEVDGLLPGLTADQKSTFENIRDKLMSGEIESNLPKYAKESKMEFLGVAIENYFENSNVLPPELTKFFNDYFKDNHEEVFKTKLFV